MVRPPAPRQLDLIPHESSEPAPGPRKSSRRRDTALLFLALAGGLVFFSSLGRIWPLARVDLTVPPAKLESEARSFLASRGQKMDGYECATRLTVDDEALSYVERTFGEERAQAWIAEGLPLVTYAVTFKKAGDPDAVFVTLHPNGQVAGRLREVEEDEPGPRIGVEQAREIAGREIREGLAVDLSAFEEKAVSTREFPNRRDHSFVYERTLSEEPELRERIVAVVSGSNATAATRRLVVPGPARRAAIAREGRPMALESVGIGLLAAFAVGALAVFVGRLRRGSARFERAALFVNVVVASQLLTFVLQKARLFGAWQTLWPRWISTVETLLSDATNLVWIWVLLFAVAVAGDALDREAGAGRGESLFALGRGRFTDPAVAAASWRGFLVGLLCGGVLAGSVLVLEMAAGARVAIQPRGFFFYALNSSFPSLSTLLFFLNVALAEELGYRFFGATWLLGLTKRRTVAIVLPAVIYGLTHTTLDFLPPAEPFWGRPLVLTLVGCVWGWAFLRYDALTVVLSHFTADLFIFNWPRLASGRAGPTSAAVLVMLVPLLPAALWGIRSRLGRRAARDRSLAGG